MCLNFHLVTQRNTSVASNFTEFSKPLEGRLYDTQPGRDKGPGDLKS